MAIVYVDPTNGNDGTGDGSSGNPYASIQYAHDNYGSWAVAAPNTIRLANTSADVLSSTIALTINTLEAPLTIEGWDNGGSLTATVFRGEVVVCGEIDGNDAVASIFSNESYVTLRNLKLHSTTSYVVYLASNVEVIKCEIYNGSSINLRCTISGVIYGCRVYNDTYTATHYNVYVVGQICNTEMFSNARGLQLAGVNSTCKGCLIHDIREYGIAVTGDAMTVVRNTVDGLGADSAAVGISWALNTYEGAFCVDNLVTNFSGGTAIGIENVSGCAPKAIGGNGFYNNTANESIADTPGWAPPNTTESGDPYTNAAADDFSLVSGASSNGAAVLFNDDPGNPDNIGYWQDRSAGGAGGGGQGVGQTLQFGNQVP